MSNGSIISRLMDNKMMKIIYVADQLYEKDQKNKKAIQSVWLGSLCPPLLLP